VSYRIDPDITQPNVVLPRCCFPGCTVSGHPPETCIAWGYRLCYPHFADYYVWSEHRVVNRAPTADEWKSFLTSLAAPPAAKRSAVHGEVATSHQELKGRAL
jgi:hypothetical protein